MRVDIVDEELQRDVNPVMHGLAGDIRRQRHDERAAGWAAEDERQAAAREEEEDAAHRRRTINEIKALIEYFEEVRDAHREQNVNKTRIARAHKIGQKSFRDLINDRYRSWYEAGEMFSLEEELLELRDELREAEEE